MPTGVVTRQRGGPRQREGASRRLAVAPRKETSATLARAASETAVLLLDRARGRADRSVGRPPWGEGPRIWRSKARLPSGGGWGVPVAESVLAPPGPIPNPVVTQRSAGEYCGGDPTGGEAAADTPHPRPESVRRLDG